MSDSELDVVTGALSYTGRHVARLLLGQGRRVRTLTGHPDRPDPIAERIEICPYRFDDPVALACSLEGAATLYNTYWVRFSHGSVRIDDAVENSRVLFAAAKRAGVRRIVHVSISNASVASTLPYFRGKALVEHALAACGLPFAVVRPTVVFGDQDVLINNIAWLLRRFPLFAVAGSGAYLLRPVHVDDVARLCVHHGSLSADAVVDAVGLESFSFIGLVSLIRDALGARTRIVHLPPMAVRLISRIIGTIVGDVLLTRQELQGMMAGLVNTDGPATGGIVLSSWLAENADSLGRAYASELARHFDR